MVASHSQLYSYKSVGTATQRLTKLVKMFTTVSRMPENPTARTVWPGLMSSFRVRSWAECELLDSCQNKCIKSWSMWVQLRAVAVVAALFIFVSCIIWIMLYHVGSPQHGGGPGGQHSLHLLLPGHHVEWPGRTGDYFVDLFKRWVIQNSKVLIISEY